MTDLFVAIWFVCVAAGCGKVAEGIGGGEKPAEVAKHLLGDKQQGSTVASLRAALDELAVALDTSRAASAFAPDAKLDAELAKLAVKLDVNYAIVGRAGALGSAAAADLFAFYAGVTEIKSMLDGHLRIAKADDAAFAEAKRRQAGATIGDGVLAGASRYAVVLDGAGGAPAAKLVELGPPFCGATLSKTGTCDDGAPSAIAYRASPTDMWTKGELATDGSDAVPVKKLVMLAPTKIRDSLVSGAGGVAAEMLYARRLQAIADRLGGKNGASGLTDVGGRLAATLTREAAAP